MQRHDSAQPSLQADTNAGERITRMQQWRILISTSLAMFIVVGFTQSFGVFQAHYGRREAVEDGVIRADDMTKRALISSIGSLGNGGLVAVFGVFYYPHLPQIGRYIRTLCFAGTGFVLLGMATAAAAHNVESLLACQGILVGLGAGILMFSLAPIVPEYFPCHSGLAQGTTYTESLGVTVTYASYLLAINSGVGIPSRLITGALADKIGHQNMLLIATAGYAMASWGLWLPSAFLNNLGLFIGMSVCHGIISGVFNTVMNSVQKELFGDEMYYPKNGAMTSIRGVGYVIGVPIAGALVARVPDERLTGRDFVYAIVYTAALLTVSCGCLLNVRRIDAQKIGRKWVR
ncbi:MFS general substrate transporter [Pyrenochaeta sp. DS3sAY3a]|nr:MFS general substrate transporter [Pyrenochaeta sp. DS3sAY3a]